MRRLKRLVLILSGAGLALTVGLMLTQPTAPKMAKTDSSQQGDMATWGMVHDQVEQTINEHHHHHCHHQDWQEQGSDDGQYGAQSEPQSEPTVTVTETQQAVQPMNTAQPEPTQAATVPVSTPTATPSPSSSTGSLWLQPCTQVGATTTSGGKTWTCVHSTKYNDTTWHD